MIIKIVYNSDDTPNFYNNLTVEINSKFPGLKVESYDVKYLKDRKKAFRTKGTFSARLDPFVGIFSDDKKPLKGFYSEANECKINDIISYLNGPK